MNSTLPSALVHRPPKVITPTSRYAPRDDWCFAASKNVGADSISTRARLRQDKPPRAHIECAPTDSVSDKGRKLHVGRRPLLAPSARGLRPQAVGERTVRRAGIFRAQTGENSCRGEHCSPVPACLTRKLPRKMRCGGKLTGDQWSPLHTQQGKTCPSPPATKNVGADSISARARLRQDKPPRAHIECAPRDSVSDQQGHPQKMQPRSFTVK